MAESQHTLPLYGQKTNGAFEMRGAPMPVKTKNGYLAKTLLTQKHIPHKLNWNVREREKYLNQCIKEVKKKVDEVVGSDTTKRG